MFTDFLEDIEIQNNVGFFMIFVTLFNICVNMSITFYYAFKVLKIEIKASLIRLRGFL